MPKIPVKLTRNEIVVPPQVYMANRDRLEAMNREGMLARNMGGVAAYRANGGTVEPPANTERFLGADVPRGAVNKLGQSLVAIGQRDFKGASEAFAKGPEEKAEEADTTSADLISLANEAGKLLAGAALVGDFVNGHRQDLTADENAEVAQAEKSGLAKFKEGLQGLISTGAGAFNQTARIREEALLKIAYRKYPESYTDYTRLVAVANKLVFPILESGALGVNPTDADVDLARKASFDYTAPSTTWAAQLNDLINREGGTGGIVEVLAQQTNNVDTLKAVNNGTATVNTDTIKVETLPDNPVEGVSEIIDQSENPEPKSKFNWRFKK